MICSGAEDHASLRTSMDGNLLKDWHVFFFDQTLEQFLQSTGQSSSSNSRLRRKYENSLFRNSFKKETSPY